MGINGAALATLITQIFTSIITPLFYKETRINTKYIIDAFLLRGIR
jgi:Na+-driven multidrug efflux pump